MIDLERNEIQLRQAIRRAKERNIIIPTFQQQKNPELVCEKIKAKLRHIGLWDLNPYNLFRITWKNEPASQGGLFKGVNHIEIPKKISGVNARIIALIGKWFPTGSHKVGATFGCLVPRLTTGQFNPSYQKAVWPSTGNYCRGGAYVASLLGCKSIAILPEEMSDERFDWLSSIAGEVITTPGSESNVKEIYDKCWELRKTRKAIVVFNQFDDFGNYLWHYEITGHAMEELLGQVMSEEDRYAGLVLSTGSAGTLASGDYLKEKFPSSKIAVGEALQCPTLLLNGYGSHRIEGIGDKHIPWIHNVRNTDMVIAVDDKNCINLIRLFNEPAGKAYLKKQGLPDEIIIQLPLLGISSVANILAAIKFSKYYELTARDVVLTILTDSMELYGSRLRELSQTQGKYVEWDAVRDYHQYLMAVNVDNMLELSHYDRKRIHNLKYYTWIEQQKHAVDELDAQWYSYPDYWKRIHLKVREIDRSIEEFNEQVGLVNRL